MDVDRVLERIGKWERADRRRRRREKASSDVTSVRYSRLKNLGRGEGFDQSEITKPFERFVPYYLRKWSTV